MIDLNGIILKPISIKDILEVLETSESDLGSLCIHENLNIKSKYKPVNDNYIDFCGYRPLMLDNIEELRTLMFDGIVNLDYYKYLYYVENETIWEYIPKTTNFNLKEFEGYNHNENRNIINFEWRKDEEQIWIPNLSNTYSIIEVDRDDILSIQINSGVFSLREFSGFKDFYLGLVVANSVDTFLFTSLQSIYNLSTYKLSKKLNLIGVGRYRVIPILIDSQRDLSRDGAIIIPLVEHSYQIDVVGNDNSNVFVTFGYHYKLEETVAYLTYKILCFLHNTGSINERVKIKNVSYGVDDNSYYGMLIFDNTLTIDGWSDNEATNLYINIEPNHTEEFFAILETDTGDINFKFSLYKQVNNEDLFVLTYTYNINTLKPWEESSLKLYVLGLDSNNIDHPLLSTDGLFDMAWSGIVPIIPEGKNYKPLKINYNNNLSVYPIYIDDFAIAFGRNYEEAPKNRVDLTLVTISSENSNISTLLTTTFYSGYTPISDESLSNNSVSKIIRIPWNGVPKIKNSYVKYILGKYIPQDLCSDVYDRNPELLVRNYKSKYNTNEPKFKDIINCPDYISFDMKKAGLNRTLYYSVEPNNTSEYRFVCIDFFRYITFILEPYSTGRIYWGKPLDPDYLFEGNNINSNREHQCSHCKGSGTINHVVISGGTITNESETCPDCSGTGRIYTPISTDYPYDYIFSTVNSTVLGEHNPSFLGNIPKGGVLCYPKEYFSFLSIDAWYEFNNKLYREDLTILTENYMWGDLLYVILRNDTTVDLKFKIFYL